jgi:hypothetical protein
MIKSGERRTSNKMKTIIYTLGLILLLSPLHARTWTDLNGRTLEAEYGSISQNNTVIVRRTSDNKKFEISLDTLSQADNDFVLEKITSTPKKKAIKRLRFDRDDIESCHHTNFPGEKECGPIAIFNYMKWWGEVYPRTSLTKYKTEDMQNDISEACGLNEYGTKPWKIVSGMPEYFKEYAPEFKVECSIKSDPDLEWFKTNITGTNAVIINYLFYEKEPRNKIGKRTGGHFTSTVEIKKNILTLNSAGKTYDVRLDEITGNPDHNNHLKVIDIDGNDTYHSDKHIILESAVLIKIEKIEPESNPT